MSQYFYSAAGLADSGGGPGQVFIRFSKHLFFRTKVSDFVSSLFTEKCMENWMMTEQKKNGEKKHKKKNFKQLFNKVDIHYRSVGAIVVHAYTWTKEEIYCARDSLYMNWIEAKSIKKTSSRYFWRMNSNSARIVIERITKQTHSKWCARFCVRNSSDG